MFIHIRIYLNWYFNNGFSTVEKESEASIPKSETGIERNMNIDERMQRCTVGESRRIEITTAIQMQSIISEEKARD